ncbi:hypothetical protein GGR56DRAFT_81749 [Xylariaceae sp. FL0804]|nr:hypothetical protein GGR56DRAFT_81749 [Xylariaceae sp. FL0804]
MAVSEKALPLVYSVTILLALALLAVGLRIYVRVVRLNNMGQDDWFCVAAMCLSVVVYIANMVAIAIGFGNSFEGMPAQDILHINQAMWLSPAVWGFSTAAVKMSIVMSYMRIWSSNRFRLFGHALLAALAAFGLAVFLGGVFACVPVSLAWTLHSIGQGGDVVGNVGLGPGHHGATRGRCINQDLFLFITSSMVIGFDLLIFAVPVPLIRKLQIPRQQQRALTIVFTIGAVACVASVMRLVAIYNLQHSRDKSSAGVQLGVWSGVECNLSIICACLPSLRPVITHMFPKLLSTVKGQGSWSERRRTRASYRLQPLTSQEDEPRSLLGRPYDPSSSSKSKRGDIEAAIAPIDGVVISVSAPPEAAWREEANDEKPSQVHRAHFSDYPITTTTITAAEEQTTAAPWLSSSLTSPISPPGRVAFSPTTPTAARGSTDRWRGSGH